MLGIVKKDLTYYAKILFFISITLLFYGFGLNIYESNKYIDPVEDFTVINDSDNAVSVNTTEIPDETSIVSDDGMNENSDTSKVYPVPNEEAINKNSSARENDNASTTVSILNEVNNQLRSEIQNEFGIAIRYGEETNNYSINTEIGLINTVPISDPSVINKQLEHLKSALNLYPNGMFQEIKNEGIPLTVLLINNYSDGSITGITDSSYTYANISIAAVHPFEESFFHESYHYIERFLLKRGATFNSWDSFNPSEFTWGTVYNGYSYSNTFSESAPFVNNYAQTSGAEDRASTFEFMMAKSKASCLNYGTVVWKKADYMAKTIDYVFDTVSPNVVEYWERFLY